MGQAKQRGTFLERKQKALELKDVMEARRKEAERIREALMTPEEKETRHRQRMRMAALLGLTIGL